MSEIMPFFNKIDAFLGLIAAILTYIFGRHWMLFAAFLFLNVLDFITGCIKARSNKKSSSKKGVDGAIKKLGYWIMILLGFGMSSIFIEIGEVIGVDLQVTSLLGWFVLATLIINEFRSIIENLVESKRYNVPTILIKGLEVANEVLDKTIENETEGKEDKEKIK